MFYALYGDQEKIQFDAILTLRKYQSMMDFVPETPDQKFIFYDKVLGHFEKENEIKEDPSGEKEEL